MRFIKMHGLGNDYVYVNGFDPANTAIEDPAALARRIADRRLGVGGDGLILVEPPGVSPPPQGSAPGRASGGGGGGASPGAHVRMRMFNADGSEAEMCGNGIRCVCKLAHDKGITTANPMRVQTKSGILTLSYTTTPGPLGPLVDQVTVDMGVPILEAGEIPVDVGSPGRVIDRDATDLVDWPELGPSRWVDDSGLEPLMTCVSLGNPHAIFYCADVQAVPLEIVGPRIETHRIFPNRVNVHFVQVQAEDRVIMRTWERGSGLTLACGTGASAVGVSGVLTGRSGRTISARLPGGDLRIHWDENDHVFMTGPATEVFTGVIDL